MSRHCLTCGTVDGKFEENHPAGRVDGIPQTDLTVTLCVPCHKMVTRWQTMRWQAGHALPACFESWLGWSDMMRLAALRMGSGGARGWSGDERRLWRRFSGSNLPKPLSTIPRTVEASAVEGFTRDELWGLLAADPVNLYRPWSVLAAASGSGYGCWVTFLQEDGTAVNYPDVRPDDVPADGGVQELDQVGVVRRLLAGWPDDDPAVELVP